MKDIKDYIAENINSIDDEPVPENGWEKLAIKLDKGEPRPGKNLFKVAAILLLLFLSTYGVLAFLNDHIAAYKASDCLSEKLCSEEQIYQDEIAEIDLDLQRYIEAGEVDLSLYKTEMDALDQNFELLKEELKIEPDDEQTLLLVIDYYEHKLLLLNNILLETQRKIVYEEAND